MSGTVACPVTKSSPLVTTTHDRMTSVVPMTRARPIRSAMTPPKGRVRMTGIAVAASTTLNAVGDPSGRARTPKDRAMGPIPFPRFEIARARNRTRNRGIRTISRVPTTAS